MSKESSDALRIPIEIKTEDMQELQGLLQDISEAKSSVRELKPLKGKGGGSSRSATGGSSSESFGIFAGFREENAVPSKTRDTKSKQAFSRESEFSKLQEQVSRVQSSNAGLEASLNNMMNGVFGISIAGQGASASAKIKSAVSGGVSAGSSLMSGGNLLTGLASRLAWPIASALIAIGFAQQLIGEWTKPGGIMDRRFKRDLSKESTRLSSLQEKAEITAGRRVIRVTTTSGLRGDSSQVRSSYDVIKKGIRIYDLNGQMAKGIGLGTI